MIFDKKMFQKFIFVFLVVVTLLLSKQIKSQRVGCYYTNWSQYRPGVGKFFPENIDPFLCTHIFYAFAKLSNSQLAPFEWNDESTPTSKGLYERTTDLKKINPNLKVLLAVGGFNMGSTDFITMVTNDNLRKTFISTSITYLKSRNFDGLDIDWEYPVNFKTYFTTLLKELKAAFSPENLLLSAAVAAGKSTIDQSYEIDLIEPYLDYLNIMSYDYHGSWFPATGFNAPLYSRESETADQKQLNVNFTVSYYIDNGFPKDKINVGLASYGRSFRLSNPNQNGLGAPASGPGNPGPFTGESGILAYYEICQFLNQGWTSQWNNEQKVPFAFSGNQWVGYDNIQSLKEKVDFVLSKGISGVMFWTLDFDDFNGNFCGQGKYPLISFVKSSLNDSPSTTTKPTSTTTSPTTKTTSTIDTTSQTITTTKLDTKNCISCNKGDGYFADISTGCQNFCVCVYTNTASSQASKMSCPPGLLFDNVLKTCNYANQVVCN